MKTLLDQLIDYVAELTGNDDLAIDSVKTGEVKDAEDLAYQKEWWDGAYKSSDGWVNDDL